DYPILYKSAWDSYLANLIMETARPADRPALVFWIRLFRVLDRIRAGEGIGSLLGDFLDIKLVVPLIVTGQAPQRRTDDGSGASPAGADIASRTAAVRDASTRIKRLRAMSAALERNLRHRLAVRTTSEAELLS